MEQNDHSLDNAPLLRAIARMQTENSRESREAVLDLVISQAQFLAPADIVHNLGTLVNMQRSKKQARAILDEFKPDLVVGTGGYASFPSVSGTMSAGARNWA